MTDSYQGLQLFLQVITFLGAVIVFFRGLEEYRRSNRTKRAEFLEKLIKEFDSPPFGDAKRVLDDFMVTNLPEEEMDDEKFERRACWNMAQTLRDHREKDGIVDKDELLIRDSFDVLLTFFTKLSYYYENELISKDELYYFKYYFEKLEDGRFREGVKKFINAYYKKEDFLRLGIDVWK